MTNFQNVLVQRIAAKKGKKNGFTLIELMVVIAIVGILTAVGLPELTKAQDRAKDSAAAQTLTNAAKECAIDLLSGVDPYDFAGKYAAVESDGTDGECEAGATLTLASEASTPTTYTIAFTGATPGVVQ